MLYETPEHVARALLSNIQGPALNLTIPGCAVRPATMDDVAACDALCVQVHGHDRHGELVDAVTQGTAGMLWPSTTTRSRP